MASLESKLLDGKCVGYCSSSEGEEEPFQVANDDDQHQANVMRQMGGTGNTGPKGVLNDFKEFREQSKRDREARDRAVLRLAQRGMLQNKREDREQDADDASNEADEDDSLESLRERRLRELRKVAAGKVVEIIEKDQFTGAIDNCGDNLLCVLIYEPDREECDHLSRVCKALAADFPRVKFVRARSTTLGMSKTFTAQALPTLQFYSRGNLVGNFIQIPSQLGHDYTTAKLKTFLKKNHINLDTGRYSTDSEYSTDDELD